MNPADFINEMKWKLSPFYCTAHMECVKSSAKTRRQVATSWCYDVCWLFVECMMLSRLETIHSHCTTEVVKYQQHIADVSLCSYFSSVNTAIERYTQYTAVEQSVRFHQLQRTVEFFHIRSSITSRSNVWSLRLISNYFSFK